MNKNKKNVVCAHIDVNKTIEEAKQKLNKVVVDFEKHLSNIVPNEMNLEKLCQTIIIEGKPLKTYDNTEILISKQSARSLKIEKTDKPSANKILQATSKALTKAGYIVNDKDGAVIATLPQFLGEHRIKIMKDIKTEKEKVKLLINKHRKDFIDLTKNKSISENEGKNAVKQFEKIKDEAIKLIEKGFTLKESQIQS